MKIKYESTIKIMIEEEISEDEKGCLDIDYVKSMINKNLKAHILKGSAGREICKVDIESSSIKKEEGNK